MTSSAQDEGLSCIRHIWWCVAISDTRCRCIPRAYGDVSITSGTKTKRVKYSPCIRGCFSDEQTKIPNRIVFPMHMGMIPLEKILGQLEPGIPHTCGGVSMPSTSEGLSRRYSPHMWGWFSIHEIPPYLVLDIPHSCGDVPLFKPFFLYYRLYSLMYMGMVLSEKFTFAVQTGIPHVMGMFPCRVHRRDYRGGIPHACGDGSGSGRAHGG